MNIVIDSTAIISIVAAAFFASGGLNAGTPFDTASTPVIAVQPFEKAVSNRNSVRRLTSRLNRLDCLNGVDGRRSSLARRLPR